MCCEHNCKIMFRQMRKQQKTHRGMVGILLYLNNKTKAVNQSLELKGQPIEAIHQL